jgi:hypothetical protein
MQSCIRTLCSTVLTVYCRDSVPYWTIIASPPPAAGQGVGGLEPRHVFPNLALSDDEEDPELDTAVEDMVTDCQVGTILHYCLTKSRIPGAAVWPRRHLGPAAGGDTGGGAGRWRHGCEDSGRTAAWRTAAVRTTVGLLRCTELHCTAMRWTAMQCSAIVQCRCCIDTVCTGWTRAIFSNIVRGAKP